MRRITLTFRLSGPHILRDLLHEVALPPNGMVSSIESDHAPTIAVETLDAPAALWDVRATVGMFDDQALEVEAQ